MVLFFAALFPQGSKGHCGGTQLLLCDLGLVFDEVDKHSARKAKQALLSWEVIMLFTKHFCNASPAKSSPCFVIAHILSTAFSFLSITHYLQQGAGMCPIPLRNKISMLLFGVIPP